MLALMLLVEGLVVCFIVLLACVVGIQNGEQGLIFLYEKNVQERAIANGLITREKIVSNGKKFKIWGIGSMIVFLLIAAYGLNGARGFWDPFWQMTVMLYIEVLFDRIFIDWYWVGYTKTWVIPDTEDLKPYIPKKIMIKKWVVSMIGFPILAAILSGIMLLFVK